jgi:urea transport system substrate-binding protein
VSNDEIAAAYAQVYLWKLAVEQAKSFDVDKVRAALRVGIVFDAPEGQIGIDAKTQHTCRYFRMGKVREDRQFDIVYQTKEWIAPDPFPQVAFPGWSCDWTKDGLIKGPPIRIAP